jgi:hypothetical protein
MVTLSALPLLKLIPIAMLRNDSLLPPQASFRVRNGSGVRERLNTALHLGNTQIFASSNVAATMGFRTISIVPVLFSKGACCQFWTQNGSPFGVNLSLETVGIWHTCRQEICILKPAILIPNLSKLIQKLMSTSLRRVEPQSTTVSTRFGAASLAAFTKMPRENAAAYIACDAS